MDMTLSKRGDYVVRSALSLARAYPSGETRKIRQVVAEMGVPSTFASQILADLLRHGLAVSKAGKDGGYRLSRPPEEIGLLDVVEAGEGRLRSDRCAIGEGPCRWDAVCPLHETWVQATAAVRDALAGTTLADLVAADRAVEDGSTIAPADSHRRPQAVEVSDSVHVELAASELRQRLRSDAWLRRILVDSHTEVLDGLDTLGQPSPSRVGQRVATSTKASVATSTGPDAFPQVRALAGMRNNRSSNARLGKGALVILDPVNADSNLTSATPPLAGAWTLTWDLPTGADPSRFEGTLRAHSVDPERSELHLEGTMRLPLALLDPSGAPGPDAQLARSLTRRFLRHLAGALERGTSSGAARSKRPAGPGVTSAASAKRSKG